MKKEALLLFLILFTTLVYADCDVSDTIYEGSTENYTASGKDYAIKFSSLKNESGDISVKFTVNGVSTSDLEQGGKYSFDDLSEITITSITPGTNNSAQICFTAGLAHYGKGTCSSSKECDDNNSCTIDECDGDPLRCHRTLILWCRDNDGCCPESRCTKENDNDCQITPLTECINDFDCDDNNTSTKDICENTTKRCNNTLITECISGDNFCPENCSFISDADCDECSTNEDCDDSNACTSDTCSGTPKRCSNTATSGCNFNGECISVGTRTEDQFCNTDNIMESLKSKKEYCDNDYECLSSRCKKNKCRGKGFISWLKGLFGK